RSAAQHHGHRPVEGVEPGIRPRCNPYATILTRARRPHHAEGQRPARGRGPLQIAEGGRRPAQQGGRRPQGQRRVAAAEQLVDEGADRRPQCDQGEQVADQQRADDHLGDAGGDQRLVGGPGELDHDVRAPRPVGQRVEQPPQHQVGHEGAGVRVGAGAIAV
ncbi:MAG: hypothetical protein ACK56I_14540, partial [bacterium]